MTLSDLIKAVLLVFLVSGVSSVYAASYLNSPNPDCPNSCILDLNCNSRIDAGDRTVFASYFEQRTTIGDFNRDGIVDIYDAIILSSFIARAWSELPFQFVWKLTVYESIPKSHSFQLVWFASAETHK
jgi:hypothetical protein